VIGTYSLYFEFEDNDLWFKILDHFTKTNPEISFCFLCDLSRSLQTKNTDREKFTEDHYQIDIPDFFRHRFNAEIVFFKSYKNWINYIALSQGWIQPKHRYYVDKFDAKILGSGNSLNSISFLEYPYLGVPILYWETNVLNPIELIRINEKYEFDDAVKYINELINYPNSSDEFNKTQRSIQKYSESIIDSFEKRINDGMKIIENKLT
jgi:hypothetical protein